MVRRLITLVESRATLVLSLLLLALMFGPQILQSALLDRTPPLPGGIARTAALNSPVLAGSSLLVRIHREKARSDCPVTSERTAVNEDGVVFDIPDATWAGGPAGGGHLDLAYPVPRTFPPGSYVLRVDLTYQCPGGLSFEYEQPEVRFRIKE